MSRTTDPLLEVRNLHVQFETYEGTAQVINGVNLTVERGETVALVGESGCGKSVTVKTILGLLPDAQIPEGEIYYKGNDLLEMSDAERHARRGKEMSMILQNPMTALNPVFTIGEQMTDILKWQGKERIGVTDWIKDKLRSDDQYRERVIEILDTVNISAPERVFDSYPVELSGGMRQRVLIANALLLEPDFLIADEPGTALDVTTEAKILTLLEDLVEERDTSVLYITHDLGVAKEISNRVNVMYAGEIVEEAPTDKLFRDPQHPYTRGLLDSIPQLSRDIGSGIPGKLPDYTNPPSACRFADRCEYAEDVCREVPPTLRESERDHAVACHLYDGLPRYPEAPGSEETSTIDIGSAPWQESESVEETEVNTS